MHSDETLDIIYHHHYSAAITHIYHVIKTSMKAPSWYCIFLFKPIVSWHISNVRSRIAFANTSFCFH